MLKKDGRLAIVKHFDRMHILRCLDIVGIVTMQQLISYVFSHFVAVVSAVIQKLFP